MNRLRFLWRSLLFYRRTTLTGAFGVAVATAVLIGSLIVGDSVTGSLRDRSLSRLGLTDLAITGVFPFRPQLRDELLSDKDVRKSTASSSSILQSQGSARSAATDAVVPRVTALGVDDTIADLLPGFPRIAPTGRNVYINSALARDLQLNPGDALLLTLPRPGAGPSGSLFSHTRLEDTTRALRLVVSAILPGNSGDLSIKPSSDEPRNIFIARQWLASQLGRADCATAILLRASSAFLNASCKAALQKNLKPEDLGLRIKTGASQKYISIESEGVAFNDAQIAFCRALILPKDGLREESAVYLADEIYSNQADHRNSISYAVIAALSEANNIPDNGIDLNRWAANRLKAAPGDPLRLSYLSSQPDGSYKREFMMLTVRSIIDRTDPGLTPTFEGISDASTISDWNTPFPIDRSRVTPEDEEYWKLYHAAPKAFVSRKTAQAMWNSSGEHYKEVITSFRFYPAPGQSMAELESYIHGTSTTLTEAVTVQPVRDEALESSRGSTDFSGLFIGLGMFLVAAAAGLAGSMTRLNVERRASEAGLLMSIGFTPEQALRTTLAEGSMTSLLGALVGIPAGAFYAMGIVKLLNTRWQDALNATSLTIHIELQSLIIGSLSGLIIGLLAVWWGAKTMKGRNPLALLGGWQAMTVTARAKKRRKLPALLYALAGGLMLFAPAMTHGKLSAPIAFFIGGALLLTAGLSGIGAVLQRSLVRPARGNFISLALRNAAANGGHSMLTVGLLAGATFVLVAVAANTRDYSRSDVSRKDSGAGGFNLIATSSVALPCEFSSPEGREKLGFTPEEEAVMHDVKVISFYQSPGDDISCLNPNKPLAPRLLGVPDEMIKRGGFTISGPKEANPWEIFSGKHDEKAAPAIADSASAEWTLHIQPGENFIANGVPLKLVGLVKQSIFAGDILVPMNTFRSRFPHVTGPGRFLIECPKDREQVVAETLRRALGGAGLEVHTTRETLNALIGVQNTYLSAFLALGGMGLLLGAVGLVTAVLLNALRRRREFALMQAVGIDRAGVVRLLVLEHAGLLLVGIFLGTACALIAVAPELAAAESAVNPVAPAAMIALIMASGYIACLLAAKAAVNAPLLAALREE